jgi:hypothetical protein
MKTFLVQPNKKYASGFIVNNCQTGEEALKFYLETERYSKEELNAGYSVSELFKPIRFAVNHELSITLINNG